MLSFLLDHLYLHGTLSPLFRDWKKAPHKLAFVTSDNPAAAGRFMEENFSAKRHDATTIKNNIDDLSKPKVKIDELNAKVTENGDALFDSNGRDI